MNQASKPIRYFAYMRKSSESEDKQALSLESQKVELDKMVKADDLAILTEFRESHSAKVRGQRPLFNEMIKRIEKGEGNGILLWHLNRLSRNAVDTGMVIDLLDRGKLTEVKTPTQTFRNTPNDKFLLTLFGGTSKLENDNKGEDVKRGLARKSNLGWYPAHAVLGYKNTPDKMKGFKTVERDPERFDIVKKMFEMVVSQEYTATETYNIAIKDWGLTNHQGKKPSISSWYETLSRPFYYGWYEYPKGSGNWIKGKHEPMITKKEYEEIQRILGRKDSPRKQKHEFLYTGALKCGVCGASVTAEHKVKRCKNGNVHYYIYYHCTKRKDPSCDQKVVEEKTLEEQIKDILGRIEVPRIFTEWAVGYLEKELKNNATDRDKIDESREKAVQSCQAKIGRLLDMRMNGEIADSEEFARRMDLLTKEKTEFEKLLTKAEDIRSKLHDDLDLAEDALNKFEEGDLRRKKRIAKALGSNLWLKDKKLVPKGENRILKIVEVAKEIKSIHRRFEPLKMPINKELLAREYAKSPVVLRERDSNPRPSG